MAFLDEYGLIIALSVFAVYFCLVVWLNDSKVRKIQKKIDELERRNLR